eukprot:6054347-Pyramimonas_sp.AAC.1
MLLGDPFGPLDATARLRAGGGGGLWPALVLPLWRALRDFLRRLYRDDRGRAEPAPRVLRARGLPSGGHPRLEGPA